MITEKIVKRWFCSFCKKGWSRKYRATEHAATCFSDPANRTCKTCLNLELCCSSRSDECGCHGEMSCKAGIGNAVSYQVDCVSYRQRMK